MSKVVVWAEYLPYLGYFGWSYHTAEPGPPCVLSSAGSESPPAFSQTVEANGFSRECLALTLLLQSNHNLDYIQAGIK